jgi:hypothetical protein
MTPVEVGLLLARMALFDARTVGDSDVAAWYGVVGDLELVDAIEAVSWHYGASTDRIMPADVRAGVRVVRDRRAADARIRAWEDAEALGLTEDVEPRGSAHRGPTAQAEVDRLKALLAERFGAFDDVRRERFARAIHRTITDTAGPGV